MEECSIQEKKCVKCGQVKPTSEFHRSSSSADGLQSYCKDCSRNSNKKKQPAPNPTLSRYPKGKNPALAEFTPRELIEELQSRGYHGELEYVYKIKV